MQIVEVKDAVTRKAFHQVAYDIYKGDPNWVPPLEVMSDNAFDPAKNAFYKHGDGTRWILKNDDGKVIGVSGLYQREQGLHIQTAYRRMRLF